MIAILLAGSAMLAGSPPAELEVRIERVRNGRGDLHLCLTRRPAHFPHCGEDPAAVKRSVPASAAARPIRLSGMAPGSWALSVMHDENRNGRLDTLLGIPREGFGFSRNPKIRFGPPKFDQVRFDLEPGIARQTVQMQYLL